ncbi:acyl carrier protein [Streptomyces sp. WZ-12]|uniref:acyl carrier protein n=1 Tax=Streptomyces sp. WZ-12 TaxID=3030210 RepID=UPI002380E224|nr:phosphopantetheine-binding protein [Streptomyces sp. WZ-12]
MTNAIARGRLPHLLDTKFRVPADQVSDAVTLKDLDLDSLALVEFSLTAEEEFGVLIPETEIGTMTVLEIVDQLTMPL